MKTIVPFTLGSDIGHYHNVNVKYIAGSLMVIPNIGFVKNEYSWILPFKAWKLLIKIDKILL